jgi:hypothetical protein
VREPRADCGAEDAADEGVLFGAGGVALVAAAGAVVARTVGSVL